MDTQKLKSGFLTSEFWVTAATFLVNVFVMLGFLPTSQADEFVKAVATAFASITTIVVTVAYIYSRVRVKTTTSVSSTPKEELPPSGILEPQATTTPEGGSEVKYIVQ